MRQVASEIATRWRRSAAIDRTLPLLVTLLVIAPMIASVFVPLSRPAATVVVLSSPVLLLVLFAIHRRAALRCGLIGLRVCRALRRGQLYLVYQPKICLETGRPVGVEALLRWDHPRKGAIAPSTYVGDLEGGVFARSLDSFVLRQAVRQAKALADADAAIPVAVNLSARSFEDPRLVDEIKRLLASSQVPSHLIEVEITERTLEHTSNPRESLGRLAAEGIAVALDDFGVGYSALQRLVRLPIAAIKIDRSFVAEMKLSERAAIVVLSAVTLGHALGLTIIAEGVETEDALHWLRGLGVDAAQGYVFARPLMAHQLIPWLQSPALGMPERRTGSDRRRAAEFRRVEAERRSLEERRAAGLALSSALRTWRDSQPGGDKDEHLHAMTAAVGVNQTISPNAPKISQR